MTTSLLSSLIFLLAGIAVIVLLTAKYKVPAFFALLIACFIVGFGVQLSFEAILAAMKEGFGHILQSLGLLIVMGTTLGLLLEKSGCTRVMANFILRRTGEARASLAMSITGFVVGLPVFCDSGYIVLSGLNKSLARRTGTSLVATSVSLATGLYAVHCLIPPHPGAATAALTVGVNFGKLILLGIAVSIPGIIAGHAWAVYMGKKNFVAGVNEDEASEVGSSPPVLMAFLPVIVPILLIAVNSFFSLDKTQGAFQKLFSILGEPVIALTVGAALVLTTIKWRKIPVTRLLQEGAEKAGSILVIIGAGGAFGAVLASGKIGEQVAAALDLRGLGIFFPFLLAFVLKTAQGSSTVAIITASSIVLPLLPALGLNTETGPLLAVLAMGAGSMMISHANDAYFWVIAKFSGLDMRAMLRTYSIATLWMGLTSLFMVYILSLLI